MSCVCLQANSLLSGNSNPHVLTGALVEFAAFSDSLNDDRASNDTRVSIENNAGATSALAGLNQATGSWDQCLQVRSLLPLLSLLDWLHPSTMAEST